MSNPTRAPDPGSVFVALYEATYADLLRFVQRRTHPTHAEDVVADAFLVAWRRLDQLPPQEADARAWLFGIARNVILNNTRGTARQRALGVRLADLTAVAVGDLDADFVAQQVDLTRAWRRLSTRHQESLALSVFDGLRAPQAAAVLGISPVAFRLRLSRARRALRLHLDHLPQPSTKPAGIPEGSTPS